MVIKTMKHFLLIAIVLFSSCKAVNRTASPVIQAQEQSAHEEPPAIQAQESAPLLLGGKHYEGRVGDVVVIDTIGMTGWIDEPRKCFLEDAPSLIHVWFDIDPLDSKKMHSLENVELLTKIKSISIYGKNLDRVDFSHLSALTTLEDLVIEGDISRAPDLTSLEKLKRITISESALESFEGLAAKNIERIAIEMKTFDSLAPLSNLTKLEQLRITIRKNNYFITIGNVTNVPRLESVILNLWANGGTIDLTGINQLTSLKNLDIRGIGYKLVNSHEISLLHNLEYILLELEDENPSIEYLRGLYNLKFVNIRSKYSLWNNKKIPHQILDISHLEESPKLEQLNLRGFVIKNVLALNHLENLDSNAIWLNGCLLFDETEAKKSTKWLIFDASILKDG